MATPDQMSRSATQVASRRQRFNLLREALGNPSLITLVKELEFALRGCQTVLDVGCGNCSPMRFLRGRHLTGMDGYAPALEEAKSRGTHDEYLFGDVRNLTQWLGDRRFEGCVALDVIEHLYKEDGLRFLDAMEKAAKHRVVIFTPNGFVPQKSKDGDLQEHVSGWEAGEMRARGYRVIGLYGPKRLRGEYHRIKYQPRPFWLLVSLFLHYASTRTHPEKAAAIFCVKDLVK